MRFCWAEAEREGVGRRVRGGCGLGVEKFFVGGLGAPRQVRTKDRVSEGKTQPMDLKGRRSPIYRGEEHKVPRTGG